MASPLLDCSSHRIDLTERVGKIRELLDATHLAPPSYPDVGSAARGLSIVLMFASYEQLMKNLCRSILESAASLRVGVKRLKPGIKLFAISNVLHGVTAVSRVKVWQNHGPIIVRSLEDGSCENIATNIFPDDGSFMRTSQVRLVCELFELGDPAKLLKEVWRQLDVVVVERNGIAHGQLTADEVGRRYTIDDLRTNVDMWEVRWLEFLAHAEQLGSSRDFYRS